MDWYACCSGYEVRQPPQLKVSKVGNEYAVMRVESPQGYSDNVICRKPSLLLNCGFLKGDIIEFDAVFHLSKYSSVEIPSDGRCHLVED